MAKVNGIIAVSISLHVDTQPSLSILLDSDGTVNRMGTGEASNIETDLFIGKSSEPLLPSILSNLTDDMLDYMGSYDISDKRGPLCKLSIGFQFSDGHTDGFAFFYGAESEGPPFEIAEFVRAAIALTNPWYNSQKKVVDKTE